MEILKLSLIIFNIILAIKYFIKVKNIDILYIFNLKLYKFRCILNLSYTIHLNLDEL